MLILLFALFIPHAAQDERDSAAALVSAERTARGKIEKLSKAGPDAENDLLDARLDLAHLVLRRARLAPAAGPQRRDLLEQSRALFLDFQFWASGRPLEYEGMLGEAECSFESGEFARAVAKLSQVNGLKNRLEKAKIPRTEYHDDLLGRAAVALARALNAQGRPGEARTWIEQARPGLKGLTLTALLLEKVDSLTLLKDKAGAAATLTELIRNAPAGPERFLLSEKLQARSADLPLSPDALLAAAEWMQPRPALVLLRKAAEACRTDADRARHGPVILYRQAEAQQALKHDREAAHLFQEVFTRYPAHALAEAAGLEAIGILETEAARSGDPRDAEAKEKLLDAVLGRGVRGAAGGVLKYLKAQGLERSGKRKEAAQLYLEVDDSSKPYEKALLSAGHCLRADGTGAWRRGPRTEALRADVRARLAAAEAPLLKLLERNPVEAQAITARNELALLYLHETVGRAEDGLKQLALVEPRLPQDDPRVADLLLMRVQAELALDRMPEATKGLDALLKRFPDSRAATEGCRSVAIRLHERIAKEASPAEEDLRRMARYYAKWLAGPVVTPRDAASIAEALFLAAVRLNGNACSVFDLRGRPVRDRATWEEAAFAAALVVDGPLAATAEGDRLRAMARLARCHTFTAADSAGWDQAKAAYDRCVKESKLLREDGSLDMARLEKERWLFGPYLELGQVYVELAKRGQRFQFGNAAMVFGNVVQASAAGSEPWWRARLSGILVLAERGEGRDFEYAKVGIENLERNHPDFDGDRFGLKGQCLDLRKRLLSR